MTMDTGQQNTPTEQQDLPEVVQTLIDEYTHGLRQGARERYHGDVMPQKATTLPQPRFSLSYNRFCAHSLGRFYGYELAAQILEDRISAVALEKLHTELDAFRKTRSE